MGEGEAEILVCCRNHGDDERTWEPLQQLWEDVPAMTCTYVMVVNDPELTQALDESMTVTSVLDEMSSDVQSVDV